MFVDLGLAFTAGVFGAAHCMGMCSGIAGGFFAHLAPAGARTYLHYHGARLLTYTLLGAGGALLGRVLVQTGIFGKGQGVLMIATGAAVTYFGVRLALHAGRGGATAAVRPLRFIPPVAPRRLPALGGILNGLVPCSLVFSLALKAAGTANPASAALLMLAFGAGTLPANLLVSAAAARGAVFPRRGVRLATAVAVILLGFWTLYEGVVFFNVMRGLANW